MDSPECRNKFASLYNMAMWLREQGTVRVINLIEEQELYKVQPGSTIQVPPSTSLERLADDPAVPQDIREEASKKLTYLRNMLKPELMPGGHYSLPHLSGPYPVSDLNRFYDNTADTLKSRAFEEYLACACVNGS